MRCYLCTGLIGLGAMVRDEGRIYHLNCAPASARGPAPSPTTAIARQQCAFCEKAAGDDTIWVAGRGYHPSCAAHLFGGTRVPTGVTVSSETVTAPVTDALTQTLTDRGSRYGVFEDQAKIAMALKAVIEDALEERQKSLAADQMEALHMICNKIARILNGDPDFHDSWHDIAGYAKLVADRLEGVSR